MPENPAMQRFDSLHLPRSVADQEEREIRLSKSPIRSRYETDDPNYDESSPPQDFELEQSFSGVEDPRLTEMDSPLVGFYGANKSSPNPPDPIPAVNSDDNSSL
jgi:predicted GH43/DUF377 family glycosyl hydrolase